MRCRLPSSANNRALRSSRCRRVAWFGILALILNGLIPAGFMPSAVSDSGWPVAVCHSGLPEGALGAGTHAAGHAHGNLQNGSDGHSSTDDTFHQSAASTPYCALGSALDGPSLEFGEVTLTVAWNSAAPPGLTLKTPDLRSDARTYWSRAPPQHSIQS